MANEYNVNNHNDDHDIKTFVKMIMVEMILHDHFCGLSKVY